MKIVYDKLSGNASYNITPREIKMLFSIVPDLTWFIKLVHVQGQEPGRSAFSRPVRYEHLSGKLNISAKGMSRQEIGREIFIELVASCGKDFSLHPARARKLTKHQAVRIDEIIQPWMKQFTERVNAEELSH